MICKQIEANKIIQNILISTAAMPKNSIPYLTFFYGLMLIIFASCSTGKHTIQLADYQLQIAQLPAQDTYIQQQENDSKQILQEQKTSNQESNQYQEKIKLDFKQNHAKSTIKKTAQKTISSIRKQIPATQKLVQTASKKWKPRKYNFNVTWKDVVFVFVLLALLALLGGILYNLLGLNTLFTALIIIAISFVVLSVYIWLLNNK